MLLHHCKMRKLAGCCIEVVASAHDPAAGTCDKAGLEASATLWLGTQICLASPKLFANICDSAVQMTSPI